MICWMCGAPADTGEHKIKKTLLAAVRGKGAYSSGMCHVKDGAVRTLQGPDSKLVKYTNCLCSTCNNNKSQPFDRAYDKFCDFVMDREAGILARRVIDFADVYGTSFGEDQTNLFKYFVKLFGCDLSSNGLPVPHDLKDLLSKSHFSTRMKISFAVDEDALAFGGDAASRPLGIGELAFWPAHAKVHEERGYAWSTYFSFLRVFYWYALPPNGPYGAPWIANSQWLYLGSFRSLDR